jgi:hypothetical protein
MSFEVDIQNCADVMIEKHIDSILRHNGLNYWDEIKGLLPLPTFVEEQIKNYSKYSVWHITGKKPKDFIFIEICQRINAKLAGEKAEFWKAIFIGSNRFLNRFDIDEEKSLPFFAYDHHGDCVGDLNSITILAHTIQKQHSSLKLESPKFKLQGYDSKQNPISWRCGFLN